MNAQKTGLLIYEMRTRKGLTQKELAEKCNVTDKAAKAAPMLLFCRSLLKSLGSKLKAL